MSMITMSTLLAALRLALATGLFCAASFASATERSQDCDWSNPGANRYTGTVDAALARYKDIPKAERAELSARMARHDYDDKVLIGAKHVKGESFAYGDEIWGMHFGADKMCSKVRRAKLPAPQPALVYTVKGHTVVVPSICGNVARARRVGPGSPSDAPLDMTPSAGRVPKGGLDAPPPPALPYAPTPAAGDAGAPSALMDAAPFAPFSYGGSLPYAPYAFFIPGPGSPEAPGSAPRPSNPGSPFEPQGPSAPGFPLSPVDDVAQGPALPSYPSGPLSSATPPLEPGLALFPVEPSSPGGPLAPSFPDFPYGDLAPVGEPIIAPRPGYEPPLAASVPEPSSWMLMLVGAMGLGWASSRKPRR